MRVARIIFFAVVMSFCGVSFLRAEDKVLIEFEGTYLAYSYDFNQLYGEGVSFQILSFDVTCDHLKADIGSRIFYAYGSVILTKEGRRIAGDEFFFNPELQRGSLVEYGEEVKVTHLGRRRRRRRRRRNPSPRCSGDSHALQNPVLIVLFHL